MEEIVFPIERSAPMRVLGNLWTGIALGYLLVTSMIIISVYFMKQLNFSIASLFVFFVLFLPIGIFIHVRLVVRGQKLMKPLCKISFDSEKRVLYFQTGFPNTMNPRPQKMEINSDNQDLTVKGTELGGYQIWVGPKQGIEATRLGLWLDLQDAIESATKLSKLVGGKVNIIGDDTTKVQNHA